LKTNFFLKFRSTAKRLQTNVHKHIRIYCWVFSVKQKSECFKISPRHHLIFTFEGKRGKATSRSEKTTCQGCGCEISSEESYVMDNLTLCDDCYLERSHRVKTCNPLATYSAKRFQESDGLEPEKRLNDKQQEIYNFIKSKGKVTPQEISDHLNISQTETENQLAILRHLELTKAKKEGSKIYIVPF
jgi:hypothetical protein